MEFFGLNFLLKKYFVLSKRLSFVIKEFLIIFNIGMSFGESPNAINSSNGTDNNSDILLTAYPLSMFSGVTSIKDEDVKDEVENPKTSDGIMITFATLALSVVVVFIARKKLA